MHFAAFFFSFHQRTQQNVIGKMMLPAAVKLNLRYQADAVIQGKSGTESLMYFNPVTGWKWPFCYNYQTRPPLTLNFLFLVLLPFLLSISWIRLTFSKSSLILFLVGQETTFGLNGNRLNCWTENYVHIQPFTVQAGGCLPCRLHLFYIVHVLEELHNFHLSWQQNGKKLKHSFHFIVYVTSPRDENRFLSPWSRRWNVSVSL